MQPKTVPASRLTLVLSALVLMAVFASDQWSKLFVVHTIDHGTFIRTDFGLTIWHLKNEGLALGAFSDVLPPLASFYWGLLCTAFAVWLLLSRFSVTARAKYGLALLAGGALGNAWDRFTYGGVIDFIPLAHSFNSDVFVVNIADIALVMSMALLLPASLSSEITFKKQKASV